MTVDEFLAKLDNDEIDWGNVYDIEIEDLKENKNKISNYVQLKNIDQTSKKLMINSLFGALDNKYFPMHNKDISGSITFMGRFIIKLTARNLNEFFKKFFKIDEDTLIYIDTDSNYFTLKNLVELIKMKYFDNKDYDDMDNDEKKKFVDYILKFIKKYVNKEIDKTIEYVLDKFNAYEKGFMGAKIEKINRKAIFVEKKRYALQTIWNEGKYLIEHPKISVTGLEMVRSSTPDFCIEKLEEALEVIFNESEKDVVSFIEKTKKEFIEVGKNSPEKTAKISSVNNLDYKKDKKGYYRINDKNVRISCPINSRASIIYNKVVDDYNLGEYYEKIEEGDKIKFFYMKLPNKLNSDVFAFKDEGILFDLNLIDYIDYDLNFDKFFLSPLKLILDSIGYDMSKKAKMEEWF